MTAETLAVTFLTGVIEDASKIGIPQNLVPVLKAANAAEFDHDKTLHSLGARPLRKKFWAPNKFFGSSQDVFATIEFAETQFVNAYLIAITAFAKSGKNSLARYAGEILGTEAEHRGLARFAQGKLPNNVAFEAYKIHTIGGIVKELEKAGVGFGRRGRAQSLHVQDRARCESDENPSRGRAPLITSDVDPTTDFDIGQIQRRYIDQFNAMSYGASGRSLGQEIRALEEKSRIPARKITAGVDIDD